MDRRGTSLKRPRLAPSEAQLADECSGQEEQARGGVAGMSSSAGRGSDYALFSSNANGTTHHISSPPWREDDKDGHYVFELGENITPRYKIISKMGEGTFGRVLECWDRKTREFVAIKVIRSVKKYRDAAMIEIDVLQTLAKHDKTGSRGCLQLKDTFDYRDHVCIVCEKLGPSLYDFLRKNNYRPFSIEVVRDIGYQLLRAVAYMHERTLIHTDLKPENVLFISSEYIKVPDYMTGEPEKHLKRVPKSSKIKLIDFGSATFEKHYHCSIVSTRQYRAPEVILGLGWSYPCDIWSIGCILVELCTGDALFQTHENLEHLAMMERILGPIPRQMIRNVNRKAEKYFKQGHALKWPEGASSHESIRAVRKLRQLEDLVSPYANNLGADFADLLEGLLTYEPSKRLTASDALEHPFFKGMS